MSKTYYIDTNILIEDPNCVNQLSENGENQAIIPFSVIIELDELSKSKHAKAAKRAILALEECYELFQITPPKTIREHTWSKDKRIADDIIANAGLWNDTKTIFVTNDRLFRLWFSKSSNLSTQEYQALNPIKENEELFAGISEPDDIKVNSFVFEEGKPVFHGYDYVKPAGQIAKVWGVEPKDTIQSLAFDLLLDDDIPLISIQSVAGMGKTYLSLASACVKIFEQKKYKKLVVIKSPIEIGKDFGHLPGTLDEKMLPSTRSTTDLLLKLHDLRPLNKIIKEDQVVQSRFFEILPINWLRGVNIEDTFLILDEAQNFTRSELRTILTRCGHNCKVVIMGDTAQVDHPQLTKRNNGLTWIQNIFLGHKDYAHLTLSGSASRGPVATMTIARNF